MKKLLLSTLLLLLTLSAFSQETYQVNTYYADLGGYVIKVYDNGAHGTVVAMQDQGGNGTHGYDAQTVVSNPDNHDIAGKAVKGWRVPRIDELTLMYNAFKDGNYPKFNIGPNQVEVGYSYWSSTVNKDGNPLVWDFVENSKYNQPLTARYNVRAVRDF
jgi:hypothetical protein